MNVLKSAAKLAVGSVLIATLFCSGSCEEENYLAPGGVSADLFYIPCRLCPFPVPPVVPIENKEKLVKFLSLTLNVLEDRILFDNTTQDAYVENTSYREALTSLQLRYANANEYKLKFEN